MPVLLISRLEGERPLPKWAPIMSGGEHGIQLIHGFGYALSMLWQASLQGDSHAWQPPCIPTQASSGHPLSVGQSQPRKAAIQAVAPRKWLQSSEESTGALQCWLHEGYPWE